MSLNFQVISSFCAELYYAMVCSAVLCLKWQFSCAFISFLIILFAYLIKYRYYIVSFAYHMVLVTVGSIQKPCQCRSFSIENSSTFSLYLQEFLLILKESSICLYDGSSCSRSSSDGGDGGFQKLIMYQKVIRISIHLHQSTTPCLNFKWFMLYLTLDRYSLCKYAVSNVFYQPLVYAFFQQHHHQRTAIFFTTHWNFTFLDWFSKLKIFTLFNLNFNFI